MTNHIALHLVSDDVNSVNHPTVHEFKQILENIALTYDCQLTMFSVKHGTVKFRFNNTELMHDLMKDLVESSRLATDLNGRHNGISDKMPKHYA